MLTCTRTITCSDENGCYAGTSIGTGGVTQARQVSAEEPHKVSHNLPRETHPEIKAWSSRLGVGHEADRLIHKKMIMLRSPNEEI